MTTKEFSLEFDILYNNIMSNTAPGLNSYEKSVFLTQAQEQLITELYESRFGTNIGFENSEKMTQYFKNLVISTKLPVLGNKVDIPDNLLFIVRESLDNLKCPNSFIEVVPTTHDMLSRLLKNPFKGPSDSRALRVLADNKINLYYPTPISEYSVTYIRKPKPIILEDLPTEFVETFNGEEETQLTINGYHLKTECEINPMLHRDILKLAVQLAKLSWKS